MRFDSYILAAAALAFSLAGCDKPQPEETKASTPELVCVSPETVGQLKIMIFDAARKANGGDPLLLNDLERAAELKVEMPLLKAHDETLQRSTCTGRLLVLLPTGSGPAFGGERELKADVEYSAQPAADRSGTVYQIEGLQPLTFALATADLSLWTRHVARTEAPAPAAEVTEPVVAAVEEPAQAAEPAPYPGRPSFNCDRARTFVEQTICSSTRLSSMDVRMAALYRSAQRADVGEMRLREMADEQQAWLRTRNACETSACVDQAYQQRISALDY